MPGMLAEATNPSSGPGPQTPPAAAPGAGDTPRGDATGPGHSQDTQSLKNEAIKLIYDERFDQLINMFETNGAEKFPRSMAIAINTAISELETRHGPIGPEAAAEVGMDLMMKLLDDIIGQKVLPDVTLEQAQEALPATLVMYADSHPDVSKEDIQAVVQEVQKGVSSQQPQAEAV